MLNFSGVTFSYDTGLNFSFPDFSCDSSEHMLILGESGTGKSTLLHVLAGLLSPKSGQINLGDTRMDQLSSQQLDKFRGENIGIIFQSAHFVNSLNVIDNLILPHYLTGRSVDREKAMTILKRLNLGHKALSRTNNLSVGEQQRVAIARALVNDPKLILADEPTSALDDKNAFEVIDLLEQQARLSQAALIIVTHDQRLKDRFSKRITL